MSTPSVAGSESTSPNMTAPMGAPPPEGVPGAAPPPAPPPKTGLSKGALVGIVVVVVVIVLVLALLFSGVIPGFKLGSSSSSSPAVTSFKTALNTANSSAASRGGSWVAIAAVGVDSVKSLSIPSDLAGTLGVTCTVTGEPSSPPSLPAYSGSYSSGDQTGWVFFLYQGSSSTLLLTLVIGSSATTLGVITGSSCFSSVYSYFTGAAGAVDSPVATSAVAADASSFLSTYSSATSVLFFLSGYSVTEDGHTISSAPTWSVAYTNCSLNATTGTGTEFTATVNGTSGTVSTNGGTSSIACSQFSFSPSTHQPQSTTLASVFSIGHPTSLTGTSGTNGIGCRTGDYCYAVIVEAASDVTYSEVGLEVRTASGATDSSTVSFTFLSLTASVSATCNADVCNDGGSTPGWTYGSGYTGSSLITSGYTIYVDLGTTNPVGTGLTLAAMAQSTYTGSVIISLP